MIILLFDFGGKYNKLEAHFIKCPNQLSTLIRIFEQKLNRRIGLTFL